jgi:hypothetical protein
MTQERTYLVVVYTLFIYSPIIRSVELPQRAAAPERFEAAHQHVVGNEELLQHRATPQWLESARQLVVPA